MQNVILLFLILLIQIPTPPQGQSEYSPLIPGNSWFYKTPEGSFEDRINEKKFNHNNVDYIQNERKYSDGTAEVSYYRIDKNNTVHYLDNQTFKETVEIPAYPRLSQKWTSSDNKWYYKVVEVNTVLKTPIHTFNNCIAIRAESAIDGVTFVNYYSKGIGFVGSKSNGSFIAYLTKWKLNAQRT